MFLKDWGVCQIFGIPHSPTSQAIIERAHQTLKRILDQEKGGVEVTPQMRLDKLYMF